jgi:hypothetical protein
VCVCDVQQFRSQIKSNEMRTNENETRKNQKKKMVPIAKMTKACFFPIIIHSILIGRSFIIKTGLGRSDQVS